VAALDPAVAAIRVAVRDTLRSLVDADGSADSARSAGPGHLVLVACSGGADSLALAATAGFVAPRMGLRIGLITIDHGLQAGSAAQAEKVTVWARGQGFEPVESITVTVAGRRGGPEAAAREARYDSLVRAAHAHAARGLLLGHTRDDQAETVLLALLRGAGLRGLAGMPARRDVAGVALLRPLLDVGREQTRAACRALGLEPWTDPHNSDPAYARPRARTLLASLVDSLGPGVVGNLARTAALAAADASALDSLAAQALTAAQQGDALLVAALAELPSAVRTRTLHAWARSLGAPAAALNHRHVAALDELVTAWRGQGAVYLPGGIEVRRRDGLLAAGRD
jgi:tRNA(Ile)-lysidine synthase